MTDDRGRRNGLGQMSRPIETPWECRQTGDCCRTLASLTVTEQEKDILTAHQAGALLPLVWTPQADSGYTEVKDGVGKSGYRFWVLTARPCPFISPQNLCTVYAVRPYNCRRFLCGRVDVHSESFEVGGPMGCHNLSDRINTSLRFMEFYRSRERAAQKEWALGHGWSRK